MQGGVERRGGGVDREAAGAVGEDQKVLKGGDARQVEELNVMALMIGGGAGTETSIFQSDPLGGSGRLYPGRCDVQWTSFDGWAAEMEGQGSNATRTLPGVAVGHLLTVGQQFLGHGYPLGPAAKHSSTPIFG